MPGRRAIDPEELYEALEDDECFAALPSRLATAFGARSVLIHWAQHDGPGSALAHSGYFTTEQLNRYAVEFAHADPWVGASREHRAFNKVINLETLVPFERYTSSLFYNEYVRAMGDDTARCAGLMLFGKSGLGYIALQGGIRQAPIGPEAMAEFDRLRPYLTRVLVIKGRLSELTALKEQGRALLDGTDLALFLVGEDCRLIEANRHGDVLLSSAGLFRLASGRLCTALVKEQARLTTAVREACRAKGGPPEIVLATDGDGKRHSILVMATQLFNSSGAVALSVRVGPIAGPSAKSILRERFGLTAAECEVAFSIAEGADVAVIARERGSSLETVRSHVKSIAAKLDCQRQVQIALTIRDLLR